MSQVAGGGLSGNTYADLMRYKTAISLVFELPALVLSAIRTRAAMLTGMKFQPHSERHMSITQNFTHIEVTPKGLGMAKVSFLACPFAYLGPLIRVSGPRSPCMLLRPCIDICFFPDGYRNFTTSKPTEPRVDLCTLFKPLALDGICIV